MKLPVAPPSADGILERMLQADGSRKLVSLLGAGSGPAPDGKYRHWDTFRHVAPPPGFTPEEMWLAVKIARRALYRPIPLADATGQPFVYALPNVALEMLHQVDRSAGGILQIPEQVANPATRDTYLFKSIVEEAITSSQLEGASTTRRVAKAMIQEGRRPTTRSERMILNNYDGMLFVRKFVDQPLTVDRVLELQRILTDGTLDDPGAAGRLRTADEDIVIEDERGAHLHTPPPADQLQARMKRMCEFANTDKGDEFMPPAVRAILLHFWLAYDHPFVDGNGRTARALFYWSMARSNYWLCEYVSISRVLRKARAQYARAYLYTESDENDATYFLLYQLRVLLAAIHDLHGYLAGKAAEIREAERLVRIALASDRDLNARQLALLNHALKNEDARYTVESHQKSHGVSYETSRSDLLKLAADGLLIQSKAGRAFVFVPSAGLRQLLE